MNPPMPCAIWSTPGRLAYGPSGRSRRCCRRRCAGLLGQLLGQSTPRRSFTSGRKFSTMTSAFSASFMKISRPSLVFRLSPMLRLLRCRFWKSKPSRRDAGHIAALIAGRLDLDDVGAPIGELAHAGRAGAGMRQVEHGETRKRLRSLRKWHEGRTGVGCTKSAKHSPISGPLSTGQSPAGRRPAAAQSIAPADASRRVPIPAIQKGGP